MKKGYRASILSFDPTGTPRYESDGLLVVGTDANGVGRVEANGSYAQTRGLYPDLPVTHWPDHLIAPGFVDLHVHYPQTDIIGAPAPGLLPWLENYTFPEESRYHDAEYAHSTATFFLDEMLRNGVTTALTFATSHPASVNALMQEADQRNLRWIAGKVLQDRHSPDGVRDETEQSLIDTEELIERWHGKGQGGRLGYAITPRFAPTSTDAQLAGAGALASKYPSVWVQSHVAENKDEIAWARALFPNSRSYLATYQDFGLMRARSVFAHCIHFDEADRQLMRQTGASAAVCPTSNLFLGSGFFDFVEADKAGFGYGLACDVGGGTSFSPFHTMMAAYYVGREGASKAGTSLLPSTLWWRHTGGAAQSLGLGDTIGTLAVGSEADLLVLDLKATPLLARKMARANSLDELLFSLIVLGDDRVVKYTLIA
jgi:guanine deaminase